jgi:hypothetical protein
MITVYRADHKLPMSLLSVSDVLSAGVDPAFGTANETSESTTPEIVQSPMLMTTDKQFIMRDSIASVSDLVSWILRKPG